MTEICNARPPSEERLSLRSYVITSTDFKRGFAYRCAHDNALVSQVRRARLPKFVWVVEIMSRKLREAKQNSVVGEVVLDASDVDLRETSALITHLPGLVQLAPSDPNGSWIVTDSREPYRSGRYHHNKDWFVDAESVASRWKFAAG